MKSFYDKDFKLGILGGGQLGRMLLRETNDLDIKVSVLDPSPDAPCSGLANNFEVGQFRDAETVYNFGKSVDLLTIEIEDVSVEALERLQDEGVKVYPDPAVLRIIKDKGAQKTFYKDHGIETAPFILIDTKEDLENHMDKLPAVQKLRTGGYDGRGVQVLRSKDDFDKAFKAPSVLESFVDFEKEVSVIIARNQSGEMKSFPLVELDFNPEANLVEFLFSPANVNKSIEKKAHELAERIAKAFDFVGLLAVEMFVTKDGKVLVNEVAPRPHNSGHHTIEGNVTSQYMQHLRSILNLPLGDTSVVQPSVMYNLLGAKDHIGSVNYEGLEKIMSWPGVHVHLYGKAETKPFRKMGHVTVTATDLENARTLAQKVKETVRVISK